MRLYYKFGSLLLSPSFKERVRIHSSMQPFEIFVENTIGRQCSFLSLAHIRKHEINARDNEVDCVEVVKGRKVKPCDPNRNLDDTYKGLPLHKIII